MNRESITLASALTIIFLLTLPLFANVCKFKENVKVKKKTTTRVILDNRRALKKSDGKYPLKLRWTCNRKSKYISLNQSCSELDFWKIQKLNVRGKLKGLRLRIEYIEVRAATIAAEVDDCDFEAFRNRFLDLPLQNEADPQKIRYWFEKKMEGLSNPNTKDIYRNSMNSFTEYAGANARLVDITGKWLEEYKIYMRRKKKGENTIAMYLRNLRHVYRNAQFEGQVTGEFYPFDPRRFTIPSSRNVKKSFNITLVNQIYNYVPAAPADVKSWELFARDVWRFMYLTNGLNPVDAAGLLYRDIKGDVISFRRTKTMGKTKHIRPVQSVLHPDAQAIIDEWGQKPATPQTFIFGVLEHGLTNDQRRSKVKNWTKQLNKYLKRIGQELDLPVKLTTMTARHCHATALMNAGAPKYFIQRSLGHSSALTTENYLGDFEEKEQRRFINALTNWG